MHTFTTQICFDVLVLSMLDIDVIKQIKKQQEMYEEFKDEAHFELSLHLIKALDNMYGDNTYEYYLESNVLPSQQ